MAFWLFVKAIGFPFASTLLKPSFESILTVKPCNAPAFTAVSRMFPKSN